MDYSVTNLDILVCACANFSWKNVVRVFTFQKMKTLLALKKHFMVIHNIKGIVTILNILSTI